MGFPGTIKGLRRLLKKRSIHEIDDRLWDMLAHDHRAGVQQIYQQLLEQRKLWETEEQRITELFLWEKKFGSPSVPVAGVDEAGRGPLAGPVTAAAVIMDPVVLIPGLNDSKQISPARRKKLAEIIKQKSIAWGVGWASVEEIDNLNIRQASFLAMKRAIAALPIEPDIVLVDGGDPIPNLEIRQLPIVGGDRISASIAAASIIAKVTRDAYMDKLHEMYPYYGFNKHKGYPTKEHFQALKQYGTSPVHRATFKKHNQ